LVLEAHNDFYLTVKLIKNCAFLLARLIFDFLQQAGLPTQKPKTAESEIAVALSKK
jgi:hypothetical protein